MFESLKERNPGAGVLWILAYEVCRRIALVAYSVLFRARAYDGRNVPDTGAVLLVSNHQSFLDPPLIGMNVRPRHADYIARNTLFLPGFGLLLKLLNCIAIKEDSGDAGAIKTALARFETGHLVVIFPEGNRSDDGAMHTFKRGAALLVKRSKCPVVPVAVEGCFDAYPRHRAFPMLGGSPIAVMYGRPISHDELMKDGADAALRRLEREIDTMRLELREKIRRTTHGTWPKQGPGDLPFRGPADENQNPPTSTRASQTQPPSSDPRPA